MLPMTACKAVQRPPLYRYSFVSTAKDVRTFDLDSFSSDSITSDEYLQSHSSAAFETN